MLSTYLSATVDPLADWFGLRGLTVLNVALRTKPEIQDDLNHAARCAKDIQDRADKAGRELTKEETEAAEGYLKNADNLRDELKRLEQTDALRNRINHTVQDLNKSPGRVTPPAPITDGQPSNDTDREPVITGVPYAHRYGKLKAFTGKNGEMQAYRIGQWMRSEFSKGPQQRNAQRWINEHARDIYNAQAEGVNTAGGVLVPTELEKAIIDLREDYGVFRRNTKVRPMTSDTLDVPRKSIRITAVWAGETSAQNETNTTFDLVKLVAKKLYALCFISSELAEDAIISVADEFAKDTAWAFGLAEDNAGFIGDSTSAYGSIQGITNLLETNRTTWKGAVAAASGHNTFAGLDNTDLSSLMGALPQYAHNGAKFYCSQVAHDVTFQRLAAVAGGNTVMTISGKFAPSYLGYPIEVTQVLPVSTSSLSNKCMILFGNLEMSSSLGERRGITIKTSDDIKFVEDMTAIKGTERVDINNHDLGNATTAGALVGLLGN